ncbi:MAG TPA: phosphate/phosphite/phosphonate ABC transporter substrate-binding protein [Sulfuriferula sp.]|nr:phosphate/phosphite/phosphonate ABC transporter substrate-binding protein [Sulfuriferula sp.]
MRKFFFIAALLLSFNLQAADRLMFGINPGTVGNEDQWVLRDSFQPLADYIGKAVGIQVRTDITQNFKAIDEHTGTGRYDLLMAPTNVIGLASKQSGFYPVAKFKDLHAVLLVRAQSPYQTVASIKGSRIGMISRKTLMGLLSVDFLKNNGLMLNRDFKQMQEIQFQDTLVSLLLKDAVDVVSVGPKVANDAIKAHPGKLRILANTDPVPGFAISLSRDMPQAQAKKITEALLTIGDNPSGKAALAAIKIGGGAGDTYLTKTSSAEYAKAMGLIGAAKKLFPPQVN